MFGRIKAVAIIVLVAGYPFLSAALIEHGFGRWVLAAFAFVSLRRAWLAGRGRYAAVMIALSGFLAVGAWYAEALTTRLIPAVVYLSLAGLFGESLRHPPSLLERLVRLQFPDFQPGIREYLEQLTLWWTGLFLFCAATGVVLATLDNPGPWTWFTGIGAYLLMSLLGLGEWLYRPRRFPTLPMPHPLDTLKLMIRDGHTVFRGTPR